MSETDAEAAKRARAVERVKAWRKANPEKDAVLRAKHRAARAAERAAYNAKWREANRERIAEAARAYRAANKQRIAERNAAYRKANAERGKAYTYAWRAKNPEASRAIVRNRRARVRQAEGAHTKDDIKTIFAAQAGKCAGCRRSIRRSYHVDHIQPLALGGSNAPRNLQLLCPSCNRQKGALDPIEWAQRNGRLV